MNQLRQSLSFRRSRRRGVLTLEWILLITVLVIGVIVGLGAVRDALISELNDLAEAVAALNISGEEESDSSPPELVGP